MSDWIEWNGEVCPVFPDVKVDIKIRSGKILEDFPAGNLGWSNRGERTDIVSYRIREQEDEPEPSSDGWISWTGGDRPVGPNTKVDVKFRNGRIESNEDARFWEWGWGLHGKHAEIIAYRIHTDNTDAQSRHITRLRDELGQTISRCRRLMGHAGYPPQDIESLLDSAMKALHESAGDGK
jgi:hypothetical protein